VTKKPKTATTNTDSEASLQLIARASSGGDEEVAKQALQAMVDQTEAWTNSGALTPRYPPGSLLSIVEKSSILPQCLDAMATGIDGWGHQFKARINLGDDDVEDQIRAAIVLEREAEAREAAQESGDDEWEADYDVPDEEVAERLEILSRQLPIQKFRAEAWFESAPTGAPFIELRQRMRKDQHGVGHGVFEFARDATGDPTQVGYIAAHTILPMAKQPPPVEVDVQVPISPISNRDVSREVQFSIYVQQVGAVRKYFKEFGDPRCISQATGKWYKTEAEMVRAETVKGGRTAAKPIPATEVLYFPLHSALSVLGEPLWMGQVPNVLGIRAAEEVNFTYFDDKCIPPGAWIIIGGILSQDVRKELENHIRTKIKGRSNFHTPLIIELVAPPGARGEKVEQPKIEWMSFRGDMKEDATHLLYCAAERDNVRSAFRLPRILTGDVQDALARANAYASIEFANTHVFSTPRAGFDWTINTRLMPALGVYLWKFVSNGPDTTDPEQLARATDIFANRGGLTPADVRSIAAKGLNVELDPIDAPWMTQPLALTLAGLAAEQFGVPADRVGAELLGAFGPDGTPEKRALAQGILKDYFARFGYELAAVRPLEVGNQ